MSKTKADLKQLIKQGESEGTALLPSDVSDDYLIDTLVAMSNCSGGTIIVGINQQSIVGVSDPTQVCNRMMDAALTITPKLVMGVPQILILDDKSVVIAKILQGLPYVYAVEGRYLQRNGTTNEPISPTNLRLLMMKRGEFSFEAEIVHQATLDDIDWQLAEQYAKQLTGMAQQSTQDILHQRGCLAKKDNTYRPTHAGILIFGKSPQQFILNSEIAAVRFAGNNMSDTFNRQDIGGTLPQQIRRAETFLIDHLRMSVKLSSKMQREQDYEYPLEAVRELIVNAVAHRDYSIQGDNIHLFMYSDHMEVHSPGSLPGPMTVENLKEERFSRNPIIVQILSDMGFIERLGYGVDRVIQLMQSQGYETPSFTNNPNGFKVTLTKQTRPDHVTDEVVEAQLSDSIIHFNGVYQGQEINSRQESALVYLHQKDTSRITNSDLKGMFPDVHPETIRRDLVDLVNKNILTKKGQKRGSYYILSNLEHDS